MIDLEQKSLKKAAASGFAWRFAERIAAQLVSFIVSTLLARLLMPEDYGVIAIINVFIMIANIFISDGFSAALIQKKNADALDYSTVLISGFVLSMFLYGICFFAAPAIAKFYSMPVLTATFRVFALRLPVASINSVQTAYLSKELEFKKFFWATIIGTLISAVVGIVMALKGCGVWALIAQSMTNYTIDTIVLGIVIKKVPEMKFSFTRMKSLLSFGNKILFTNLLFTFVDQLRTIIIGKFYSATDLAYYSKGRHFPQIVSTSINGPLSSVLFPAMAKVQDDKEKIKSMLKRSTQIISYLITPLMLGMAAVSKNMVLILLTEKWLPCVPFIWLGAIYYILPPIHSANLEAVKAVGRGDQVFKYGLIKRSVSVALLLLTVWFGVEAIAIGLIFSALIATFINAYQNKRLFNYSYKEQFYDIFVNVFWSFIMCLCVYLVGRLNINLFAALFLQVITGVIIYILISVITKNPSFLFFLGYIKKTNHGNKN